MQHAEAHERLSDLALEPGRLTRLEQDIDPEAAALREHVALCQRCTANVAGWQRTWAETQAALDGEPRLDLLRAPATLRGTILAAAAAAPATLPPLPVRAHAVRRVVNSRALPWLLAAAAIVVAVVTGAAGIARTNEAGALRAQTAQLETVAATFDRVLAAPKHWAVTLRTADGTAGGTLAWSASDIVVVTTGVPAPGHGQAYRCWVESNGVRSAMGTMSFAGSTGYWVGSMYAWSETIGPGARYGVSLVPDGGQGTPVLIGSL
jgi:hypothetical protein